MKKSIFIISIILIGCSIAYSQKKIQKSFDNVKSIVLNTASGDCQIVKGSGNKVLVDVVYSYDDNEFEARMVQNGNKLEMEEKFKKSTSSGSSNWTITIPDDLDININTGSGNLKADNIKADIEINSGSGAVEIVNITGNLDMNTGSGDLQITRVSGEMKFNTGSGEIRLEQCNGSIRSNTGSGDIRMEKSEGGFKLNTGSGDVEADGIILIEKSNFNSGSGDVEIALGKILSADISMNSGSGNAILDYNGMAMEGVIVMKAKKRGGDIEAPFEFDTTEEIEEGGEVYIQKTKKFGGRDIEVFVGTGTGKAEIRK